MRDALVAIDCEARQPDHLYWSLPGRRRDVGRHASTTSTASTSSPSTCARRYAAASGGPVAEGSVGGGTGMICHLFKGGIGTASRVLPAAMGGYTVGVLVQANYGWRERLHRQRRSGGPDAERGRHPAAAPPEFAMHPAAGSFAPVPGAGSIVGIAATDAPLLPHQCDALAQRVGLGVSRTGNAATTGAATSSSPSRPPTGCRARA